jgi:hypothetical protein
MQDDDNDSPWLASDIAIAVMVVAFILLVVFGVIE